MLFMMVKGQYIEIDGERFYCIENYNHMQPFFISLASDTDLWMRYTSRDRYRWRAI